MIMLAIVTNLQVLRAIRYATDTVKTYAINIKALNVNP